MRIAINGFGRIGRTILRRLVQTGDTGITVAGINDIAPIDTLAYLLRYDSTYGPWPGLIEVEDDALIVGGQRIPVTQTGDAATLDLSGIDVFLECTGKSHSAAEARVGLERGARNVLVSGPCPGAPLTIVMGANDADLGDARIVSNASCTTNAIAPLMRCLDDAFGLVTGHVTTVHCYTNSQPLVDNPRDSLARSRAAALSMVPTTTSATALVGKVLPDLANRLTGAALRVPTASVSCIDAVIATKRPLPDDLEGWLTDTAATSDVLGITADPVVSTDMRANPASLVIARPETKRMDDHHCRIFGWYDNEYGFASRMIDMARRMGART